MERVAVVGSSGSGKSTLSRLLARRLDLRHVELDAINHGPGWAPLAVPEFRRRVADELVHGRWVVDGNYRPVQDLGQGTADTIVFLDLPRLLVTSRVARRSLRRVVTRQELWNGNRETWRNALSTDPERSVAAWTWQHHPRYRDLYLRSMTDGTWAHAEVVHLTSKREVRRFCRTLPHARTRQASFSTNASS